MFPLEIIDHILYFTHNTVTELCRVCKYFNQNVKKIRITSNEGYPNIKDEHLSMLPNLSKLIAVSNLSITIKQILKLTNLRSLFLRDIKMTDEEISSLVNLTSLTLVDNRSISDEGISKLVNLTSLILVRDQKLTTTAVINLTKLMHLRTTGCYKIDYNNVKGLNICNKTGFELKCY